MKKIVTILIAIALIAMIGTAAAEPAEIDFMVGTDPNLLVITLDNAVYTTDAKVYAIDYDGFGDTHNRTISIKSYEPNLQVRLYGHGIDTGFVNTTLTNYTYVANGGDYTFTVEVKGTSAGNIGIWDNAGDIYIADTSQTACDHASASGTADIPEFPTIALPVAAILGLAFIFQRRREEE